MRKKVAILVASLFIARFGAGLLAPVLPAHACDCPGWRKAPRPPSACFCSGSCRCCYCGL
jgi:hypothetical protein